MDGSGNENSMQLFSILPVYHLPHFSPFFYLNVVGLHGKVLVAAGATAARSFPHV